MRNGQGGIGERIAELYRKRTSSFQFLFSSVAGNIVAFRAENFGKRFDRTIALLLAGVGTGDIRCNVFQEVFRIVGQAFQDQHIPFDLTHHIVIGTTFHFHLSMEPFKAGEPLLVGIGKGDAQFHQFGFLEFVIIDHRFQPVVGFGFQHGNQNLVPAEVERKN